MFENFTVAEILPRIKAENRAIRSREDLSTRDRRILGFARAGITQYMQKTKLPGTTLIGKVLTVWEGEYDKLSTEDRGYLYAAKEGLGLLESRIVGKVAFQDAYCMQLSEVLDVCAAISTKARTSAKMKYRSDVDVALTVGVNVITEAILDLQIKKISANVEPWLLGKLASVIDVIIPGGSKSLENLRKVLNSERVSGLPQPDLKTKYKTYADLLQYIPKVTNNMAVTDKQKKLMALKYPAGKLAKPVSRPPKTAKSSPEDPMKKLVKRLKSFPEYDGLMSPVQNFENLCDILHETNEALVTERKLTKKLHNELRKDVNPAAESERKRNRQTISSLEEKLGDQEDKTNSAEAEVAEMQEKLKVSADQRKKLEGELASASSQMEYGEEYYSDVEVDAAIAAYKLLKDQYQKLLIIANTALRFPLDIPTPKLFE